MNPSFKPLVLAGAILAGGGAVWLAGATEKVPVSELAHIHGIAVDPADPKRLYLATHHGLFRTEADGTAALISEAAHDFMGFTPHPSDPGTFYSSGHPAGGGNLGFLVSEDAGQTWKTVSPGANGPVDFHAMDVSLADPEVVYGLYGDVQVSRDGGKTWEIRGRPPADVFDLAASATDPDTVYAATRQGLMVSRDSGRSWQPASLVTRPASLVATTPDGSVYAFQIGMGLLKASEPGLGWERVADSVGGAVLLHLAADPTDPTRLYAVTDGGAVLASADGGRRWAPYAP